MFKASFLFMCMFTLVMISNVARAQLPEVPYYTDLKQIKLFKSSRIDVESLFKYPARKESAEADGSKTVYYDLKDAKLSVYYSTGRCSEHRSKLGFDVNRDIIIGVTLDLYQDVEVTKLDFDLKKFRRYQEKDNNAVHYTSEELGIELTGGSNAISSITFSGSESQREKYRCK